MENVSNSHWNVIEIYFLVIILYGDGKLRYKGNVKDGIEEGEGIN